MWKSIVWNTIIGISWIQVICQYRRFYIGYQPLRAKNSLLWESDTVYEKSYRQGCYSLYDTFTYMATLLQSHSHCKNFPYVPNKKLVLCYHKGYLKAEAKCIETMYYAVSSIRIHQLDGRAYRIPSLGAFNAPKICPCWELLPTAVTSILPCPSKILLPDLKNGELLGVFTISSDSPVKALSSTLLITYDVN